MLFLKNLAARFLTCAVLLAATAAVGNAAGMDPYLRPAQAPSPADNRTNAARAELGKTLFFDPRLSKSNWISCATCHNPSLGWSDGLPTGFGHDMKRLTRATPTLLNVGFQTILMWDGRHATLEEQALAPIRTEAEMNLPIAELLVKLEKIPGYVTLFQKAYPGEGVTEKSIGKALASFQRTVTSTESPFDRWRRGDQRAVDASVKRGFELFTGKANCAACHKGFNFTDNSFHNIGVREEGTPDLGRFQIRKVAVLKGAFKTPTLRDVALTAPYMRNGIYTTLEEVIDHYDRGGDVTENLSPEMKPLNLTARDKADVMALMKSLTGAPLKITLPQLPQ